MEKLKKYKARNFILVCMVILIIVSGIYSAIMFAQYISRLVRRLSLNDEDAYCQFSYPSLNVSVLCFWAEDDVQFEEYVDLKSCAGIKCINNSFAMTDDSIISSENTLLIADHNYQGFDKLENAVEGDSVYLTFQNGTVEEYYVVSLFRGYNENSDLTDEDGNSVLNQNSGGIIVYTCAEKTGYHDVWIMFLQPSD